MRTTIAILCALVIATPIFAKTRNTLVRKAPSYCTVFNLVSGECWRWEPWLWGGCAYKVYNLRTGQLIRQDATLLQPCGAPFVPPEWYSY
jgi:hypothetical protein